jgi:outer membrane protein assembly factor BamE (lipoprotein component of BamABCDE complex)
MHAPWLAMSLAVLLAGCMTASEHRAEVESGGAEQLTVGKVQREIRVGMSGAEVTQVLGSPNIVTTDDQRREVWVYDKISTESVYSESRGGVAALIFGSSGSAAGLAAPSVQSGAGARSTTQRTLTVIIKFDKDGRVRDFAYHATKF